MLKNTLFSTINNLISATPNSIVASSATSGSVTPSPSQLTSEQQSQRAAVYSGLLSIFSQQEADIALEKWSAHFTEAGSVFNGINSFARDVCTMLNHAGQHRELVKAINLALMNKNQQNNVSPALKLADAREQTIAKASVKTIDVVLDNAVITSDHSSFAEVISTPDFQTFQLFLPHFIQLLSEQNTRLSIKVRPFLIELTTSMPWAEMQQQQVIDLMTLGKAEQTRTYRADQLKVFVKHLRLWLEDELGAYETDNLFNQTVIEIDATDIGSRYSARHFI